MRVGSALAVVLTKNLFHAVLWLALALPGTAGVFLLLDAEFLAAADACFVHLFKTQLAQVVKALQQVGRARRVTPGESFGDTSVPVMFFEGNYPCS